MLRNFQMSAAAMAMSVKALEAKAMVTLMSSAFPGLNEGFLARYIVYIVVAIYPPKAMNIAMAIPRVIVNRLVRRQKR